MNNMIKKYLDGATIFLKAAKYIETCGWQVSGMGIHGGPRCSMGALESAGPKGKWDKQTSQLMYTTLYSCLDGINLSEFNEKAKNSHDVVLLFRHVAKLLQEKAELLQPVKLSQS